MNEPEVIALIPHAGASGASRGWRCPDEERLAGYVHGALPGAVREKVEEHLADCAFCCGQVGFLARAERLGPAPAVPGHLLAGARSGRSWTVSRLIFGLRPATLAAAGAGLVLALMVATPRERPGPLPTVPSVVRSGRGAADAPWIVRPSEGESVSRKALELRWEAAPGALFYTVQLVDPKGDVVWEGRADGTRVAVPPGAALAPGRPYFAWVLAHRRSGATVRSPAVGFRLAPP